MSFLPRRMANAMDIASHALTMSKISSFENFINKEQDIGYLLILIKYESGEKKR